jgi:C-terminal processing protease CtpA/Prc
MVILVGSGHVAYGLGIERQARKWFSGTIASVIPVSVGTPASGLTTSTQASYANYIWGIPEQIDSDFPMLGTSTAVGQGDAARRVINVQKGTPADKAGIKVGDVLVSVDGVPIADKEVYSRLMAAKRWGDSATIVVQRGPETVTLTVAFRRTLPVK